MLCMNWPEPQEGDRGRRLSIHWGGLGSAVMRSHLVPPTPIGRRGELGGPAHGTAWGDWKSSFVLWPVFWRLFIQSPRCLLTMGAGTQCWALNGTRPWGWTAHHSPRPGHPALLLWGPRSQSSLFYCTRVLGIMACGWEVESLFKPWVGLVCVTGPHMHGAQRLAMPHHAPLMFVYFIH